MNAEQMRARLAEIAAELEGIEGDENGHFTEDQLKLLNAYEEEYGGLETQLQAAEKRETMLAKTKASQGRKTTVTAPVATTQARVTRNETDKFGGFKNGGDFLMAVKDAANGKTVAQFQNVAYEKNGEDGGFLVPEDISQEILKKFQSADSLLSETRSFKVSGNTLSLTLDESQPWNAGIQAYWTAEGAQIQASKPKFTNTQWRLQKLAALVQATDELLEDATALESYIKNAAPEAIMYKVNSAILTGNGVGKPEGIINSPFAVTVPKESGQAVDTIVPENIIKMYSRMIPSSRPRAKWYINAGAEAMLNGMKNTNGDYIFLSPGGTLNQSPYGLLMGRPVVPMMFGLPALGDLGDIMFADLSYYYSIQKAGGVKSAESIHLLFDREITSFRFSLRVDGKVPFKAPVTTEFGSYSMSGIVLLEAR